MNKKIVLVFSFVIFISMFTGCKKSEQEITMPSTSMDDVTDVNGLYFIYQDFEEIVSNSDIIVLAKCIDTKKTEEMQTAFFATTTIYKGTGTNDENFKFEIKQYDRITDELTDRPPDNPYLFTKGEDYILFLVEYSDNNYRMLSKDYALYVIDDNGNVNGTTSNTIPFDTNYFS